MILLNKALKKNNFLYLFIDGRAGSLVLQGLLTAVASLVAEQGSRALRLSSCGSQALGYRLSCGT